MRLLPAALSALLLSSTVAIAQTGFTLKTYPASPRETTIRVADFNHDGKPDLLVYGTGQNEFHVYLNDGSGGFSSPIAVPATYGQVVIAKIADLKGDGVPDIVACTATSSSSGYSDSLVAYVNDGNGNFTPTIQGTQLPGQCTSVVVGDVDLDGHQDVIVGSARSDTASTPNYQNYLETFFGDGTGKLAPAVTQSNINLDIPTTNGDTNCRIDDTTGGNFYLDNQFSLFVTSICIPPGADTPQDFGTVFLAHGDGTGHFTFTPSNSKPGYSAYANTVDLNVDGSPDVVFANAGGYGDFSMLNSAINNGSGNFTYNQLASNSNYAYFGITSADFNGDGLPDIATTLGIAQDRYAQAVGPSLINIYTGSASGTFTQSQSISIGNASTAIRGIAAADFNGDGSPDLATLIVDYSSATPTTQLYVYSSSHACIAPTTSNSNVICSPANGATSTSPVPVSAASNVPGLTLNRLYLDNNSVYETASPTVSTSLTIASGSHRLVLVSYNNEGQAFTSASTFTVGSGTSGECSQSAAGATICSPAAGSTTDSPTTITAAAMASAWNITAIRAYIDNNVAFTVNNSTADNHQQVSQSVTVAAGTHHLVIVGYQSNGGNVSSSEDFTVSGSTPCYPSSVGASICSPSNGSTVSSTFNVTAGATAGSGYITAIRVYVDSVAKALIDNPQQSKSFAVNPSISEGDGQHSIVVVGYQSTGGSVSAQVNVTVP